jgi:hypothetical protein
MSYEPPPQQPGGNPHPEDAQGQPGQPTPPPQSPYGGYVPPPEQPSTSGQPTMPTGPGSYVPPGSYPPPPPGYTMPSVVGGTPTGPRNLWQAYLDAVIRPTAATYASEIPNASWGKTLLGVLIVAALSALIIVAAGGLLGAQLDQSQSQVEQQLINQGQDVSGVRAVFDVIRALLGPVGAGFSFVLTFVLFFLGAVVLFILAKMFGGQGDFMTHTYLLSLSYTPVHIVETALSFVPCISLITIVLPFYQLFCAGRAIEASHRLRPGRAQLVAFLPLILLIVLCCICCFAFILLAGGRNR